MVRAEQNTWRVHHALTCRMFAAHGAACGRASVSLFQQHFPAIWILLVHKYISSRMSTLEVLRRV